MKEFLKSFLSLNRKSIIALLVIGVLAFGTMHLMGLDDTMEFLGGDSEGPSQQQVITDLCIPIERVRTWNPLLSADEDVYYVEKLIYEGLFQLDETLTAEPVLAESWSFDETGTVLAIQLKQGVLWHDGRELSAEDVKFTIESLKKAPASMHKPLVDVIKSVKTSGNYGVELTFVNADDSALEKLTFPILPAHQYKNLTALLRASEDFVPVGTGRYRVDSIAKGEAVHLASNLQYHGTDKATNTLTFKVTSDNANPVNLFAISDLNLVFLKNIDRETMYSNKDVKVTNFTSNEAEILGFNMTDPTLSQKKVRQAIAYAVDVDRLLDHVYYNSGVKSDSLYYPEYLGTENEGDPYSADVEKARTLLRQAGYTDGDGGMFRDANGKLLTVTLTVNEDSTMRTDAAAMIQSQLLKAGIDCQIQPLTWEAYQQAITYRTYDLFLGGYRFSDSYDLRFLLQSTVWNPAGYVNPKADELLNTMGRGKDAEDKKASYESLKTILSDELPYYCMFYKTYGRMSDWELQTEDEPLFADLYRGAEHWRLIKPLEVVDSEE
ncbi:MAG: peptide ABC transporter substrate-binding protein [Firmicutes bacterium]|nr:peptide ABC transporter substrate-binding protein [Bacillota bacterium]